MNIETLCADAAIVVPWSLRRSADRMEKRIRMSVLYDKRLVVPGRLLILFTGGNAAQVYIRFFFFYSSTSLSP